MGAHRVEQLSGWGRYPVEECRVFRPNRRRDVAATLAGPGTFIPRGLGRS